MAEPQDSIPGPGHSVEYHLGYSAGHIAGVSALARAQRAERDAARTRDRTGKWITAGFWACVLLVGVSHLIAHLSHDYSRVDAFEDGVILMVLIGRLSRPRYPR